MLQWAGKEGLRGREPLPRHALQLVPVVAEADDHGAGVQAAERLEQKLDTLVVDELPEVDDRRPVAGEERLETLGVPIVRQALVSVVLVPRVLDGFADQAIERLLVRLG